MTDHRKNDHDPGEVCEQPFCAQTKDVAPAFSAEAYLNPEKKIVEVALEDYQGKWVVLFFYGSDFTFVWPTELAAVAALYPQLQELNVEVLGISTDSVYAHKVFTEVSPMAAKVQYPLVSDRTQEICRSYRVLNESAGAAFRATVIVNPDGRIVSKLVNPPEVGRNVYEILRLVQGIQYGEKTGEGVPANWLPGQPGIKMNARSIGRI